MDADVLVHRALADPSRSRLLATLREADGPLAVTDLAAAVNLRPATVRGHLAVLSEAGLVSAAAEPRASPGRPRLLYTARSRRGDAETDGYRLLARVLASHLEGTSPDPSAAALEAGRRWGSYLAERPPPYRDTPADEARRQVLNHLTALGFDPQPVADDADTIRLQRCPFLDTAKAHTSVVCAIHLGLMRGMLDTMRAPLTARELLPFDEATACVTRLGPADGAAAPSQPG